MPTWDTQAIPGHDFPVCCACRHVREWGRLDGTGWTCAAFPDGIPPEIITRRLLHHKPHPGDHGVRFEAADGNV